MEECQLLRLELAVRGLPHRIPETVTGQYIEHKNLSFFAKTQLPFLADHRVFSTPACDACLIGMHCSACELAQVCSMPRKWIEGRWISTACCGMLGNAMAPDDSSVPTEAPATEIERQSALDRLSKHAFELGLYDRNEMPEGCTDD